MAGDLPTPIFRNEADLARLSASDRIRYRLIGAGCRYHANDNISGYIEPGEMDELKAEVETKMQEVLRALGPGLITGASDDDRKAPGRASGPRCMSPSSSRVSQVPSMRPFMAMM